MNKKPKYQLNPSEKSKIRLNPPSIMNIMEASAFICCSPRKLRDLIHEGKISANNVGTKITIRKEKLEAYLDANIYVHPSKK